MNKLTELSPEQLLIMDEVKNYWIDKFNSCHRPDTTITEDKIRWLYWFSGLSAPEIIWAESPMSAQIIANGLNKNKSSIGNSIDYLVNLIDKSVTDLTDKCMKYSTWMLIANSINGLVGTYSAKSKLDGNYLIENWISYPIGNSIRNSIENKKLIFYPFYNYGNSFDFGWVSFYDFFTRIGIINDENFNNFRQLVDQNLFGCIYLDGVAILIKPPGYIRRDSTGRLHSKDSSAIRWSDGYELFFLNGIEVLEMYLNLI